MFNHATATGKSEHDCAVCWGRQEPSLEWDMEVQTSQLQWILSDLIPLGRTLQTFTMMSISSRGSWVGCTVRRRWRCNSARKSWTQSRNTSGASGHLLCQGQNQCQGTQPMSLGMTHRLSLMPEPMPLMTGLWVLGGTLVKKP